jgi:aminoglycoside phosphotransferase (APT) family kinase protein
MATGALDTAVLRDLLAHERPGLVNGPLTAELITGGRSNLTYAISDSSQRWILRRPPLGHVLATAHDMGREYRVMAALAPTDVPVPRMVLLHEDSEPLGAPFFLMSYVSGEVYRTASQTASLGRERARALAHRLVDVLVTLHAVDPAAVGLAEFGRPHGYLERQLRRWGKQLAASTTRPLPSLDLLTERLLASVPVSRRHAIVHGDYRLDNTIVADDRIAAVVDWEMATLGDPLADIGLMTVYWDLSISEPGNPVSAAVTLEAGFPSSDELVAYYASRSGVAPSLLPWYRAFGHFKLAVIAEGIHYRHLQGLTVGPGFDQLGTLVEPLARRGLALLADT